MKIGFGSDHVSVDLKNILIEHVKEKGYECIDFGTNACEQADYPEFALKTAEAVIAGVCDKAILLCGTGVGMSLAANKVPGIRAAVCSEPYSAKLTVQHNNANILTMGSRVVGSELAKMIADNFLDAVYEGGRHQKRIDMISEIEKKYSKK